MRKLYSLLLMAIFFAIGQRSMAQAGAYQFTATSGTFTALGGSATAVSAVVADDAFSAAIPIGFSFSFAGTAYTNVYANSNGFLSFSATAATTATVSQQRVNSSTNAGLVGPAAFALWDDAIGYSAAPASSTAKYEVTGSAGSRVFTFEWKNWVWWYSGTNVAGTISFQAKLYEGTNIIEYIYQQESNSTLNGPTATIGLAASSSDYLTLSAPSASPTASSSTFTTGISTRPATGQVYRFTPPAPCVAPTAQPTALTLNATGSTTATGSFTAASPPPDRYLVVRTTTNVAPAPANGTTYPTGTSASLGGYVEVAGNTTSFSSTGLTAGTTYYYWVFSYNSQCSGGPLYRTVSPLSGNVTTGNNITSAATGNWSSASTWTGGVVPTSTDAVTIQAGHSVTVNSAAAAGTLTTSAGSNLLATAGTLNIAGASASGITNNGSVTISGGTIIIGAAGSNNRNFINNSGGTLSVSSGTLSVFGNVAINTGSNLNQSGGMIKVDGNNGGSTTNSVATGTPLFAIGTTLTQRSSGSVSLTGGTILIVDPHPGAGSSDFAFFYNGLAGTANNIVAAPAHTLQFGDGVSTDAGGNATYQFGFNFWAGESAFTPGKLVVDALSGTNRAVRTRYTPYVIGGDLIINSGEFLELSSPAGPDNRLHLGGNLTVNGTFTGGLSLGLDNATYDATTAYTLTTSAATSSQAISGTGTIRNGAAPTGNLTGLFVNNTAGVQSTIPLVITDSLSLNTPVFTAGANTLTLGTSATGTGVYIQASGYINGQFKRWISAGTGTYNFGLGTTAGLRTASINFTVAPSAGGTLLAEWVSSASGGNGLPLTEGSINITRTSTNGFWRVTAANGLTGGTYTGTFTGAGISQINDYTKLVLLKRTNSASAWTLNGTHVATTGSNAVPVLSRTGMSGFSEFGIGSDNTNPLPVTLVSFTGVKKADFNRLQWTTATEVNNRGFELQRSIDGRNFSGIAFITGKGENLPASYSFDDTKPHRGGNFYRLRQVDKDGSFTYSPVVELKGDKVQQPEIAGLFPNPAIGVLNLSILAPEKAKLQVVITAINGKTVVRQLLEVKAGTNNVPVNIANLGKGIYTITLVGNETGETKGLRFVKQ